ncbi:MAG TPA: hypothetical protein VJN93_16910 [Candidatus Acidoferrum sp.]|nr:hypothetical protein [Candidatus Acidoferrum sp.]
MKRFHPRFLFGFLLSFALFYPSLGAPQPGIRIGGEALSANGQLLRNFEYVGSCPVQLKFDWGVISSAPISITYTFRRNDGSQAQPRNRYLPGGGRSTPILDTWNLGANTPQFANYHGRVELNIQAPVALAHKINFTLHCQ